jgi:D-glycero-D-manno-heptose 1,7-bisphosphate phosphatase
VRRAVFLDRDGVINEGGQINRPEEVVVYPDAAKAIVRLKKAGFAVVIATNQGGLGEGFEGQVLWRHAPLDRHDLEAIHAEMLRQLGPGAEPDLIKVCPHATFLNCPCRKPKPGMLRSAARELGLDMASSFMVGDRTTDLEAAVAAGVQPILVLTGDGESARDQWEGNAPVTAGIGEAAELILSDGRVPA